MASFQQLYYCKNCKKNVPVNDKGQCAICGSVSLNKSWSVRFRYIQENGKEIQKRLSGFSTRREANDAFIKFTATAKKYNKTDKEVRELIFSELYDEYMEFSKKRIKESSFISLMEKCNKHILPYFKDLKVKDIQPKLILNWQQGNIDNYSYAYKTALRKYLSSILNYAEKYYKIPNQIKYVDNFRRKEKPKEMQIWSPLEFEQFINAVDNINYRTFFLALFYTGARKGEMMATTWNDWNLESDILNIDKTLTKKTFSHKPTVTSPKNDSSVRKISIPLKLKQIMENYKNICKDKNELVFKMSETSITRYKKNACMKAGIREIRLHDFRHTHASLLISEGVSIVAVAKRLGHKDITQTLNTYSHLMEHEDTKVLSVLDNCINF